MIDKTQKDATAHTLQLHQHAAAELSSADLDPVDYERATRGLIAQHATGKIDAPYGTVWDINRYDFITNQEPAPATVNPSLWRQSQLNVVHGLFEVAPGLWQARGYDISNISFIKGDTGWIVIDPLTSAATAKACLELVNEHVEQRPVVAVIFTHSHADHFGGILGVTSQEEVDAGKVRIIAPEHFLFESVSENLLAGPAMGRRSAYQFGPLLPSGPKGHVDCGLGKAIPLGMPGLMAPTEEITETGQELVVDGVRIIFQLTPETEAPAEMNFFFPDFGWLCTAEVCTHTMHNLVPIRGAQARDSLMWSRYIGEAIELFGKDITLMFASHHWPRWGGDDVRAYLSLQRDLYRWMHDQTLRWANHGYTPNEIADTLELPPEFQAHGHTRGYYGTLVHNCKAVYQRYLSWYDGNPARLNTHTPVEAGKRYVEFMGGADSLLEKARVSFDAGDYRWVAEVVNHLVFADPTNEAARSLQADALEQLGYQSESSTYRNAYLMGAQELRNGYPQPRTRNGGLVKALTIGQAFDLFGVRLKSEEVGGLTVTSNWTFTDIDQKWVLGLANRTLHSIEGRLADNADVSLTLSRMTLLGVLAAERTFMEAITAGDIAIEGDGASLLHIFGHLDQFPTSFAIVEP